jgi:hypothetical protein
MEDGSWRKQDFSQLKKTTAKLFTTDIPFNFRNRNLRGPVVVVGLNASHVMSKRMLLMMLVLHDEDGGARRSRPVDPSCPLML